MNPVEELIHVESLRERICKPCKGFGCNKCNGEGFIKIKTYESNNI